VLLNNWLIRECARGFVPDAKRFRSGIAFAKEDFARSGEVKLQMQFLDESIELADRLHSAAIHLLRRLRREDDASGLPAPQLSALSVIVFRGPITMGALATAEQVRPPTMTRVVATLEWAGLVKKTADPSDGRVQLINATAKGRKMLQQGRMRRVKALAAELAALAPADRELLQRGTGILERVVGPRQFPVSDD
jgi:DNA-binding MarR family transcriptional regulator